MGVRALLRTNYIPNPSLEYSTFASGWASYSACTTTQSNEWSNSRKNSAKLVASGTTSDCFTSVNGDTGAMRLGMVAGNTYTVSGYVYTPFVQTGPVHAYARKLALFYKGADQVYRSFVSDQGPAVGVGRVSLTFTLPADTVEAFLRPYNGSPTAGDIVYWDDLLLSDGPNLDSYFDGSSLETRDRFYKWNGMVDNSVSYEYSIVPDEWSPMGRSLADLKTAMINTVLGPSPTRTGTDSFSEVKKAALEKVLSDNGIAV